MNASFEVALRIDDGEFVSSSKAREKVRRPVMAAIE